MHIDTIPSTVTRPKSENLDVAGIRYCFCYFSQGFNTSWDGRGENFDWKNPISILWDDAQLAAFRPDDTVHCYRLKLRSEMDEELQRLMSKRGKKYEQSKERIEFLQNYSVVFVKITYE